MISNKRINRKEILTDYISNRPAWSKILRLLHRATNNDLSNKADSAINLLLEIKQNLITLCIEDLRLNNNFKENIQYFFNKFCKEFQVDSQITTLLNTLFKEF